MDASAVLGVPPLRAALLDDLPDGDAKEGRRTRRGGRAGGPGCRAGGLVMPPLWRADPSVSDDFPYPPDDDEDDDDVGDDEDDEDEDDEDEEPEWQLVPPCPETVHRGFGPVLELDSATGHP
jgi:hypothetical protein